MKRGEEKSFYSHEVFTLKVKFTPISLGITLKKEKTTMASLNTGLYQKRDGGWFQPFESLKSANSIVIPGFKPLKHIRMGLGDVKAS